MIFSIIVPVYNEEGTIAEILKRVSAVKLPSELKKEVIVVDDGSTDKTPIILKRIKLRSVSSIKHARNQGKGAAIRTGLKSARGEILTIQDADLEYNPQDFIRLLEPILSNRADVVYGTRMTSYPLRLWGRNKTPHPSHWIANKFLSLLTNVLYGSDLSDMETCYKMFSKKVIKNLTLESSRFDIEPEITAKILKKGYQIVEVPIKIKPRTHKEGKKINWKDGIVALWTLIRYRF